MKAMACQVRPYEGQEKYIFISYCHKDSPEVFPIIEYLAGEGLRLWYDEGIDPGSEWPEMIADHLNSSAGCIALISENSLKSHNCRREINYAILKKKPFLAIFLEKVQLSPGMEMQLSAIQAIFKYTYDRTEKFYEKLLEAPLLKPCYGAPVKKPKPSGENTETSKPSGESMEAPEPDGGEISKTPKASGGEPTEKLMPVLERCATGEIIALDAPVFKVGRSESDCQYAIRGNLEVSRVHAVFYTEEAKVFVSDAGSTNKTRVGRETLVPWDKRQLNPYDLVLIGGEQFLFKYQEGGNLAQAASGDEGETPYLLKRRKTSEEILIDKPLFRLGKSKSLCDYAVEDNILVSRLHVLIESREDGVYVMDEHSTNHTYVNGRRLTPEQWLKLRDGDELSLAGEQFLVKKADRARENEVNQ